MAVVTHSIQQLQGRGKRASVVVTTIILHVLEKENRRAVLTGDTQDFIQQRAPGVLETALVSRDAEGLTGKPSAE